MFSIRSATFALVSVLIFMRVLGNDSSALAETLTTSCVNPLLPDFVTGAKSRHASSGKKLDSTLVISPRARLRLAVARDQISQEIGLMCIFHLQPTSGMVFVFQGDDNRAFWMRNTYVPLDLLWTNEDGLVTRIAANVPATPPGAPDSRAARRHGTGHYVIEMLAGTAAAYGIIPGTRLLFFPKP